MQSTATLFGRQIVRVLCLALFSKAAFGAPAAPAEGARAISAEGLMKHVRTLASDEFEGRGPGTEGETRTVAYLAEQFRLLGLAPGNPDGTYVQKVPLIGSAAHDVDASYTIGGQRTALAFPGEACVWTKRFLPEIEVNDSEMVFVGYGVVAPEYQWDDFKDVDVRGKTLVILVNDPPVPDAKDPTQLDETMFKGRAMTYYGRWTYKYEIAAQKGAAAAIIIHETGPAGYPWIVVVGSNSRENFDLSAPDKNMSRLAVQGWMTQAKAEELFKAAGHPFAELKKAAVRRDFKPVPLGATARFHFQNSMREVASQNVVAKLEGADPRLKDEYVIYTAHWDHLGRNRSLEGDQIFNGALDNATGVASMLAIAEAFARTKPAPKRSLLFLAVTAEEKGLLGAKYYARSPLYPLDRTLADMNLDAMNPWGRTKDISVIGFGQTTLEDLLRTAATAQGRTLAPDSDPEKGYYFRSDHFEFAKVGVPGLYLQGGKEFIGRPADFGAKKHKEFTEHDYHKVSDDVKADWDLSGTAEDARLYWEVGRSVADGEKFPEWKAGSEFQRLRPALP